MLVIGLVIALVVAVAYVAWEHSRWRHGRMRGMLGDQWRRAEDAAES